jgi:hypothetical protein
MVKRVNNDAPEPSRSWWWLGPALVLTIAVPACVDAKGIVVVLPSLALLGAALYWVKRSWEKDDLSLPQKLGTTLAIGIGTLVLLPFVLFPGM